MKDGITPSDVLSRRPSVPVGSIAVRSEHTLLKPWAKRKSLHVE
jgi:hypothetical protein